jgi:NAD(P)-dependent dehydrogenase (short-subunit alcohol dehydrogenase family)
MIILEFGLAPAGIWQDQSRARRVLLCAGRCVWPPAPRRWARRPTISWGACSPSAGVANLICYVCSKASSPTNGAALRVDGGIVTNPL